MDSENAELSDSEESSGPNESDKTGKAATNLPFQIQETKEKKLEIKINLNPQFEQVQDEIKGRENKVDSFSLKMSSKEDEPMQNSVAISITESDSKSDKREVIDSKANVRTLSNLSPNPLELKENRIEDVKRFHQKLVTDQTSKTPKPKKVSFFKQFDRRQKIVLLCLCLVEFACFCSMSIMAPFFPKEAVSKGMSETTAGLVFSFYALVMFISAPFLGKVLPQVGAKNLFLFGIFLTSSCNFLFGFLGYIRKETVFAVYCFIVQGFKALGASSYCTATYVFVAEAFPAHLSSILGILETFVGLGMSVGPAIGGFFYEIGGFGLPFYILGAVLFLMFPISYWLLPVTEGNTVKRKSGSLLKILREPNVVVIGLVVVANSNIWAFLDPTLEPHLRKFNLTSEKIGLIFLLFSAWYGLSSIFWGVVSDKTNSHWSMMSSGLLVATVGLLLLGPAPFLTFLESELWLNLVALSILGVAVALSLLPTFQNLISSVVNGGHGQNDVTTYSIVSGVWSSLYALGEVIGPLVGGVMTENYGFPFCCTVLAGLTFTLFVGSFVFFLTSDCLHKKRIRNHRYKFQIETDS